MKKQVHAAIMAIVVAAGGVVKGEVVFTEQHRFLIGSHYTQRINGIALSPDEQELYVAFWSDTASDHVQAYSTTTFQMTNDVAYGTCHGDAVVSADGRYFFAPTYYSGNVSRWDRLNGNARTALPAGSWPVSVAMTPDRTKMIVMAGSDGRSYDMHNDAVCVYDIAGNNFSPLATTPLTEECPGSAIVFTPDGAFAYFTTTRQWVPGSIDRVYEFSMTTYAVTRTLDLPMVTNGVNDPGRTFGIALAGNRLLVGDRINNKIRIYGRVTFAPLGAWDMPDRPGTLALAPDGTSLYVLFPSLGALRVFDVATGNLLGSFDDFQIDADDIEFTRDGRTIYVSGYGARNGVVVLNVGGGVNVCNGDGPNGTWEPAAPLSRPRDQTTAAVVNEKLYLFGAHNDCGYLSENLCSWAEMYDPISNSWTRVSDMPTGRGMAASAVVDGVIYVIGGDNCFSNCWRQENEAYDPASNTWVPKAPMPTRRGLLSATAVNGKIYAMGGADSYVHPSAYDKVEVYDPRTNTWTDGTPMPRRRSTHAAVELAGKIYLFGGFTDSVTPGDWPQSQLVTAVDVYDPSSNTWTTPTSLPTPRMFISASVVDDKVYVIGGDCGVSGCAPTSIYNIVEVYDPVANCWTTGPSLPAGTFWHSSVALGNNIHLVGGDTTPNQIAGTDQHFVLSVEAPPCSQEFAEDFSADPGWVTDQPNNYYWDSANHAYHATTVNAQSAATPSRYAYTRVNYDGGAMKLEFDINPVSLEWSAGVGFGLFDSNLALYSGTNVPNPHNIFVHPGRSDGGLSMPLYVRGLNGIQHAEHIGWNTFSEGIWYHCVVQYDQESDTASLTVTERSTGNLIGSTHVTNIGGLPADLDYLGYARDPAGDCCPTQGWCSGYSCSTSATALVDSIRLESGGPCKDFEYKCVVVARPTDGGTTDVLPTGLAEAHMGQPLYVELWARDSGEANTGLVSVYTDMDYPETCVATSGDPQYDANFDLFHSGNDNGSMIDELGGSQISQRIGIAPEWARVATVPVEATEPCEEATFSLRPADAESSAHTRGLVLPSDIDYGACKISICTGCECIFDLDNNCSVAGGDLGRFAGCWLCDSKEPCWAANGCQDKDFDCNGLVAAGDLGWFAGAWQTPCSEINTVNDYPSCRQCAGPMVCPWPEGGRSCSAPSVGAVATAASPASGKVQLSLRLYRLPPNGALDESSLTEVQTVRAGERYLAKIWAKDTSPTSEGLTAVFADLRFDAQRFQVTSVKPGDVFTLFRDGAIDAAQGIVKRLGGATMAADQGVHGSVLVAAIKLRALQSTRTPQLSLAPSALEAVARHGQGLVPVDQIEVVQRVRRMKGVLQEVVSHEAVRLERR